jgi:hypothetical protein
MLEALVAIDRREIDSPVVHVPLDILRLPEQAVYITSTIKWMPSGSKPMARRKLKPMRLIGVSLDNEFCVVRHKGQLEVRCWAMGTIFGMVVHHDHGVQGLTFDDLVVSVDSLEEIAA